MPRAVGVKVDPRIPQISTAPTELAYAGVSFWEDAACEVKQMG